MMAPHYRLGELSGVQHSTAISAPGSFSRSHSCCTMKLIDELKSIANLEVSKLSKEHGKLVRKPLRIACK